MPIKTTLEDGSVIDTFTADELEAQKQAAIEEFKTKNPDNKEEVEKLQADLTKANEELKKFADKDFNFSNLRTQKEAAEKKVEEIIKGIDDKINAGKKEVLEAVMKDHYNDTLKSLSGNDEEIKKKIEFHYKRLGDQTLTKEEISKKLQDAYFLATKPVDENALNSTVLSSQGSKLNINSKTPFSAEEKALAQKMASAGGLGVLKDEDFK